MNTKCLGTAMMALALMIGGSAAAQDEPVRHGRVSFADESGLVKGESDEAWSYATANALVLPGDTLWADEAGTLEVEFPGATYLRLADGSKVEVVSVPPDGVFRGWEGAFYLHRMSDSVGSLKFETPVGVIHVQPNSQVRVDVLKEGSTTVSVRWGRARVQGEAGGSVTVSSGQRTYIDPGYLPSTPTAFNRSQEDEFDAWNRDRARLLAMGSESVPIATSTGSAPLGTADLNAYGEWVYVDDSYYWRPTTVVEYVPYRRGHWSYVPSYGNVWVGQYPFSYVTSHHGYWHHHNHYGWIWRYNRHWRPAYAAAVRYGDYFVWSPLSHHGGPVHYGSAHFTAGDLHFSLHASSFAHRDHVWYGGNHHVRSLYGHQTQFANIHANDVHIWNLFIGDQDRHRDSFRDRSSLRVRDYSPRRVMRGPATLDSGRTASARIDDLRRSRDRASFRSIARAASGSSARAATPTRSEGRSATVRSVRVDRSRSSDGADLSSRLRQARTTTRDTQRLMARRGGSMVLTNEDARNVEPLRSRSSSSRTRVSRPEAGGERSLSTRSSGSRPDVNAEAADSRRGADSGRTARTDRSSRETRVNRGNDDSGRSVSTRSSSERGSSATTTRRSTPRDSGANRTTTIRSGRGDDQSSRSSERATVRSRNTTRDQSQVNVRGTRERASQPINNEVRSRNRPTNRSSNRADDSSSRSRVIRINPNDNRSSAPDSNRSTIRRQSTRDTDRSLSRPSINRTPQRSSPSDRSPRVSSPQRPQLRSAQPNRSNNRSIINRSRPDRSSSTIDRSNNRSTNRSRPSLNNRSQRSAPEVRAPQNRSRSSVRSTPRSSSSNRGTSIQRRSSGGRSSGIRSNRSSSSRSSRGVTRGGGRSTGRR